MKVEVLLDYYRHYCSMLLEELTYKLNLLNSKNCLLRISALRISVTTTTFIIITIATTNISQLIHQSLLIS